MNKLFTRGMMFGAALTLLSVGPASAVGVNFGGQVDPVDVDSCTITLGDGSGNNGNGTLALTPDLLTLSSLAADGGTSGFVTVKSTTGSHALSVQAPNRWDTDSTGNSNPSFGATLSTGGNAITSGALMSTVGTVNQDVAVTVDLTATQNQTYSAGTYNAIVIVTCE